MQSIKKRRELILNCFKNHRIFADETRNIHKTTPETYDKLVTDNITTTYKSGEDRLMSDINSGLKDISCNLGHGDRIDVMAKTPALITLKTIKIILIRAA